MKSLEQRVTDIEFFLQCFCALQLVQQGVVECSVEDTEALQSVLANQLEEWKENTK